MSEETINVFVYGTLRTGQGNWRYYLENNDNVKKICDDTISGFVMFNLGSFPAIVPLEKVSGDFFFSENITGEVFSVDSETLRRLDGLEGYRENGNGLYNRMEVETGNGNKALVYFMNQERNHHRGIIESGDWLNR